MHSTIRLEKTTKFRLSRCGDLASTYDSVINKILDHIENCNCCEVNKDASG